MSLLKPTTDAAGNVVLYKGAETLVLPPTAHWQHYVINKGWAVAAPEAAAPAKAAKAAVQFDPEPPAADGTKRRRD